MAARQSEPLKPRDIQGLKYLDRLLPLLDRLHDVGCRRDKAGNRSLHFDQYCLLVLLSLFNPVVRSLRALQQASQLEKVRRKLGCSRVSLGSLSESVEVFDPERLRGIIETLATDSKPVRDVRGGHLTHVLTAVDGSVVKTLKSIAQAVFMKDKNGGTHSGWRLHTHFDIDRHVPTRIDVTPGSNGGRHDEKSRLRAALAADRCYVMDRWYAQFTLWNDIVTLGTDSKAADRPGHAVRVVLVKTEPHVKRGGRKGGTAGAPSDGVLRLATNLTDVPAEVIADIYRHRWTIERFFRFFKHVLGCRHPLSTRRKGIEIQAYCAIIACLLISKNLKPIRS